MMEWPRRKRDRLGLVVQTTESLSNRLGTVAVGTEAVVFGSYNGATIETRPCAGCGLSLRITRVPWSALSPLRRAVEAPAGELTFLAREERRARLVAWSDPGPAALAGLEP